MSMAVMELDECGPCRLCGDRPHFYKGYGPELGLCCQCAGAVVDLHRAVHSGAPQPSRQPIKVPVPDAVRWSVLRRDGFRCVACGATDRPMHVDHVNPRAKGGGNDPDNLQCLCDRCNMRKGAK